MTDVAVFGASGFVGTEVVTQLGRALAVRTPRRACSARDLDELRSAADKAQPEVEVLKEKLEGAQVVVVACGMPDATGDASDEMYGANALAPLVIMRAAAAAGCRRLVHVSSAVVQGAAGQLDSQPAAKGFSGYSHSKILAEQALTLEAVDSQLEVVIYRPPSVHAADRRITRALTRVASSPLSAVAGDGSRPTPQALRENVGSAIAFLTTCDHPPLIVHHPWEGISTGRLMTLLSDGRQPISLPERLARFLCSAMERFCHLSPRLRPHARRLEMLWFGQTQAESWLEQAGWRPRAGNQRWVDIAREIKRSKVHEDGRRRTIVLGVTVPMSMNLMRGFPEHLSREGWDVHFVSSGPRLKETHGFTHHVIPMHRDPHLLYDLLALLRWTRLLRRIRPDVVAVGTPKAGLLGSIAAWICRVPARIYKLRGLRLETSQGWRRAVYLATERVAMAAANRVVVVSPSLRGRALELRLAAPARMTVLGYGSSNGIDVARFNQKTATRGTSAPGPAPVIGFVGRLTRDKGVFDLIEACQLLVDQGANFRLSIIGGVEDRAVEECVKLAKQNGLPVDYNGYMEDPAEVYSTFDLLCLPTYREGFPTVVLEAAAAGLPTVTTTATGAIDAVVDGETGFLVEVGQPRQLAHALQRLIDDEALRLAMGSKARERAKRYFSQTDVWGAEVAVYEELLAGAPSRTGKE